MMSPGPMSNTFGIDQATATAYPPLSRTTPFGFPLVPDVCSRYSGSVALTVTGSTGFAEAIAVVQLTSSGPSTASVCCCTITRLAGWCSAISMALFNRGRYPTVLPPWTPLDADTTTTGLASSIRAASSLGANQPETTQCTAPIRAQPSIATTACGIIGR